MGYGELEQVANMDDQSEYVYFLPALLGIAIISMLSKNRHVHAIAMGDQRALVVSDMDEHEFGVFAGLLSRH